MAAGDSTVSDEEMREHYRNKGATLTVKQILLDTPDEAEEIYQMLIDDGDFESVTVIYGGAGNEDEVWVTVKRTINSATVRYLERFADQNFSQLDEVKMVDSAVITSSVYVSGTINLASDTVRCNNGLCNSGRCGGKAA